MAAGVDAIQNAISPGSTAYGERGALESAISAGAGAGGVAGVGSDPVAQGGGTVGVDGTDPLGALLGGEIPVDPNMPVTSGLSVGPGPGRAEDTQRDPVQERLIAIAFNAQSPQLRAMARGALRQMVRSGRIK